MSAESFAAWGWRVPFIASIVLVGVGLFVRLKLEETASFTKADPTRVKAKLPFLEVVTQRPREALLAAGATTCVFAFFYIGVTYLTTYGTTEVGLSRPTVLAMGIVGGAVMSVVVIGSAILSDRLGRRRVIVFGNAFGIVGGLIAFPIIDIGTAWSFGLGLSIVLGVVGLSYGALGAFLPELFPTRYRYTGAGIAYNLAGVLGGGVVPLIAAAFVPSYGSLAIGLVLVGVSALSLVCTLALPQTNAESFDEQDALAAAKA